MYCSDVWDKVNWFSPVRVFHTKWNINCRHIWRLPSGESAIQESVEQLEPSSSNPAWYWILFKVGIGCISVEGGCTSRPNTHRSFVSLYTECAVGVFRKLLFMRYDTIFQTSAGDFPAGSRSCSTEEGWNQVHGPRSMFPTVYYMWVHFQRRKRLVKATIFEYNKYDLFLKKITSMDNYV